MALSLQLYQLLFGCAIFIVSCYGEGIAIIGPNVIQPNRPFSVAISNSLRSNAILCVSLSNENNIFIANRSHITETVKRRSMKIFTFKVGSIPQDDYSLKVENSGGSVPFSKTINLQYVNRTLSIFVQTDKPVYKPGDMLRFRIVMIDIDTKPVSVLKSLVVDIKDNTKQLIKQWKDPKLHNGIFETAIVMPSSPPLGNWTLNVTADDGFIEHNKQQHFLVKEYVLPTFIVDVVPTEVLLIENKKISLTIKSFYTFGEPVKGHAKVDLYLSDDTRKTNHSKSVNLEGSSQVEFHLLNEIDLEEDDSKYSIVKVKLTATEAFTNRAVQRWFDIPVYRYPFDITRKASQDLSNASVVQVQVEVYVKEHDGRPICCGQVQLEITYDVECSTGKFCKPQEAILTAELDKSGVASFTLDVLKTVTDIHLQANVGSIKNFELESIELDNYDDDNNDDDNDEIEEENDNNNSNNDSSNDRLLGEVITIRQNSNSKLNINKDFTFVVQGVYKLSHFWYVVINQASIVTHGFVVPRKTRNILKIKLTPQMAPKSQIIVLTTIGNNLYYSTNEINFNSFRNNFKFMTDFDQYAPSQDVEIVTDAATDSFVAYHAIDVGALHLGHDSGFGFTKQEVLDELDKYVRSDEAPHLIGNFGFFLESSVKISHASSRMSRFGCQQRVRNAILLRTDFPEVSLWHNISMRGAQSQSTVKKVPDSITSWRMTGFALSPTAGLGMMDGPVTFVVKKPFYIIVNLPYSIKRNEVSRIQVTIFSFLGSEVTTDVWLYNKNNEFEFMDMSSSDNTKRKKSIMVPGNNGQQTSFLIKAKKIGHIALKIEAVNALASDGMERMLLVTPESRRYERNEARFIELGSHGTNNMKFTLNLPKKHDEGSVNITMTANGDLLGPVIENLQSLFQKPIGCGEQSMIKFVPNVVILDYLEESGYENPVLKTEAVNFLQEGYVNQLKYKLSNGSFAVFERKKGSTFLTAFVAKSFKIAAKYITVDKTIVMEAFDWLSSIQDSDGLFPEVGDAYNIYMQGGLHNKRISLSAFVAIAFLETADIAQMHSSVINKTINYLAANLKSMSPYELALATYALTLSNHTDKEIFLLKLMDKSTYNDNEKTRYWDNGVLSVETTSYALLSSLGQGKQLDALTAAKWLISQRKSRGEFPGTQATFVGLKALAKVASTFNRNNNEYRIIVRQENPPSEQSLKFDIDNTADTSCVNLPVNGRTFKVEINGRGYGALQLTYQYNQNIQQALTQRFNIKVQQLPQSTRYKEHMQVCAQFDNGQSISKSNMALVEVFLPSGYEADEGGLQDLWQGEDKIQKIERRFAGTSVVVYYNSMHKGWKCFNLSASRVHLVARQLPSYVVVYDYEQEDDFGIQMYQGTVLQPCDICDPIDCKAMNCY